MAGKLNSAQNITVINLQKIDLHMQCQRKQCLITARVETLPNSLRQTNRPMQKQGSIDSV